MPPDAPSLAKAIPDGGKTHAMVRFKEHLERITPKQNLLKIEAV